MPWDAARSRNPDYGTDHRKARAAAAAKHRPTDPCVRCKQPLGPMGPHLHYDHNAQRTGYLGFSHKHCNLSAAALVANARRKAKRLGLPTPRTTTPRTWL